MSMNDGHDVKQADQLQAICVVQIIFASKSQKSYQQNLMKSWGSTVYRKNLYFTFTLLFRNSNLF